MERDPSRFVWRAAPTLNAALVLLAIVVGLPVMWLTLDLMRLALDLRADTEPGETVTLFRYAVSLPERIRPRPLVLFPGFEVARRDAPAMVAVGLAAAVAAAAALWWAVLSTVATVGQRALDRLAVALVDGIAAAPAGARDDARAAALLSVDAFGSDRGAFGLLATAPALAASAIAVAGIYVALHGLGGIGALILGLLAMSIVASRRIEPRARRVAAERSASSSLGRALSGLAGNLPAIARHGTRGAERTRIAGDLARVDGQIAAIRRQTDLFSGLAVAAALVAPAAVLAIGIWTGDAPGTLAAATLAATGAVIVHAAHLAWRSRIADARPIFAEMARVLGGFQARRRKESAGDLAPEGVLAAEGLGTGATPSGRLSGVDLKITLPSHVALCGAPDGGARTFAAVLGGEIAPSRGRVTLAGRDALLADDSARARRLAFAGGSTYLFAGSLKANLLYGSDPDAEDRLPQVLAVAGLDAFVERRGLSGTVDPRRDPALTEAIVTARAAVRRTIAERALTDLVEPFDAAAYSEEATVGENILFGVPVGDTFREDRLPSQAFVTAVLDREGLTKPFAEMGAAIARNTIDMFAELRDEHSLVARFALVAAAERDAYESILERRAAGGRRTTASGRDAERLIGLALRYSERRHRLGLLGPDLKERIVRLRSAFAAAVPKSLSSAIEFFQPDQLCAAASLRDNLLFGRVVQERSRAERDVRATLREVLEARGLTDEVARIGLGTRIDPADPELSEAELAGIELVRCLVRSPDNLVVEHALDHLTAIEAVRLARRLAAEMKGRGLILAVPGGLEREIVPILGRKIVFASGRPDAPEPVAVAAVGEGVGAGVGG